jgi:hypothetical protein
MQLMDDNHTIHLSEPLSNLVASISHVVLSIRTSSMFCSILIVVNSTIIEKIRVQMRSMIFHSSLY